MYMERGGKHNQPHIHAKYQNDNIVIALNGEVFGRGAFLRARKKLLDAWMEIHLRRTGGQLGIATERRTIL